MTHDEKEQPAAEAPLYAWQARPATRQPRSEEFTLCDAG
jgi:hypothetical protein